MRTLNSHNEQDARRELRGGEFLVSCGAMEVGGQQVEFFGAETEEAYAGDKDSKLNHRRKQRSNKRKSYYD